MILWPKIHLPRNCENCEEDSNMVGPNNLKDQVWQNQLQNRQIIINGEIDESIIEKAVVQIMNINQFDDDNEAAQKNYVREPVLVMINSPGGLLDEAFSLISVMESSTTQIDTLVLGKAWSAGFLILLAGKNRFAQRYSSLMLHQGSAGVQGEFSRIAEYSKYYDVTHAKMMKFISKKCKISAKKLDTLYREKQDWYIDPEEAIELKIIDTII